MNTEEQVKNVIAFQMFTQMLDPFVIEQFKLLPLVYFPQAQSCELKISKEQIIVTLIPKPRKDGLKFDFTSGKSYDIYVKELMTAFDFWFRGLRKKPQVIVQWKQND